MSLPVDLVEYTVADNLSEESTFTCWVPYVINNRKVVISKINSRYHKCIHKYKVYITISLAYAQNMYKDNGNTLWMYAYAK